MRGPLTPDGRDVAGAYAIRRLELTYMRARFGGMTQREVGELREAICLARGWDYRP